MQSDNLIAGWMQSGNWESEKQINEGEGRMGKVGDKLKREWMEE